MKKLTKNFHLDEFLYSPFFDTESQAKVIKIYNDTPSVQQNIQKLANQLQILRDRLNRPIKINIAFRPVFWEHKQGRSGNSQHTLGKAADIVVKNMPPEQVKTEIENLINSGDMLQGGLSAYKSFCHYDIRRTKARW